MLVTYLVMTLLVSYSLFETLSRLRNSLFVETVYGQHFERMSSYLNDHAPSGSRIFHTNWSDSQYLIGFSPQMEYLVTFGPIYMYSYNPKLYNAYRAISFGEYADPYPVLRDIFQVQYIYAGKNYFSAFIQQLRNDSRFRLDKEDELGIIFSLKL